MDTLDSGALVEPLSATVPSCIPTREANSTGICVLAVLRIFGTGALEGNPRSSQTKISLHLLQLMMALILKMLLMHSYL